MPDEPSNLTRRCPECGGWMHQNASVCVSCKGNVIDSISEEYNRLDSLERQEALPYTKYEVSSSKENKEFRFLLTKELHDAITKIVGEHVVEVIEESEETPLIYIDHCKFITSALKRLENKKGFEFDDTINTNHDLTCPQYIIQPESQYGKYSYQLTEAMHRNFEIYVEQSNEFDDVHHFIYQAIAESIREFGYEPPPA